MPVTAVTGTVTVSASALRLARCTLAVPDIGFLAGPPVAAHAMTYPALALSGTGCQWLLPLRVIAIAAVSGWHAVTHWQAQAGTPSQAQADSAGL
jgi:hypothetical protein